MDPADTSPKPPQADATTPALDVGVVRIKHTPTLPEARTFLEHCGITAKIRPYIFGFLGCLSFVGLLAIQHAASTEKYIKEHGFIVGYERQYFPPVESIWFWVVLVLLLPLPAVFVLCYLKKKRQVESLVTTLCAPVNLSLTSRGVRELTAHAHCKYRWSFFTGWRQASGMTILHKNGQPILWWSDSWITTPEDAGRLNLLVKQLIPEHKPVVKEPF